MYVFTRAFRFGNSNAATHCNDIFDILQSYGEDKRPKILGLLCDNGPDFNPASWIVVYFMGQLWKDMNLDQLIICSYAPHSSKYNPIELAWGTLSQALAQITLVSDHEKYDFKRNEDDLKRMFTQAQGELQDIWTKALYAGKPISCKNVGPNCPENPYHYYDQIKEFLKQNKEDNDSIYMSQMEFLLSHCIKRRYYLHFKKCEDMNCPHCSSQPIRNLEAMDFLQKFEYQLPIPTFMPNSYSGEHYPSLLDFLNDESLQTAFTQSMKDYIKKGKEDDKLCKKCSWFFESQADSKKHRKYCKKLRAYKKQ
jgi:hypothetical protein